jgi:hypothetical protein
VIGPVKNDVLQGSKSITGMVVDESGIPVSGTNVRVKSTTNDSITNMDGVFTLSNVSPSDVLQISYIGYVTQEKTIDSNPSSGKSQKQNI